MEDVNTPTETYINKNDVCKPDNLSTSKEILNIISNALSEACLDTGDQAITSDVMECPTLESPNNIDNNNFEKFSSIIQDGESISFDLSGVPKTEAMVREPPPNKLISCDKTESAVRASEDNEHSTDIHSSEEKNEVTILQCTDGALKPAIDQLCSTVTVSSIDINLVTTEAFSLDASFNVNMEEISPVPKTLQSETVMLNNISQSKASKTGSSSLSQETPQENLAANVSQIPKHPKSTTVSPPISSGNADVNTLSKPTSPGKQRLTRNKSLDLIVENRIRLGICAMEKKARSKPMSEILSRLNENVFEIVFFGDNCLLYEPIEEWPTCDALIAFFSKGYPLQKVKHYVERNKIFNLNDLDMQILLQDRRRVYDLLEASGIDVPKHAYLSRDGYIKNTNFKSSIHPMTNGQHEGKHQSSDADNQNEHNEGHAQNSIKEDELLEFDDHIEINGVVINKPFVEKPVNAEDHNISIYYPTSAGGGCKKLFRKVGNRSSEFYPFLNEIRHDGGSYIYEEFVETQGTDVKMYTVGPEYGHAEARKSPTVDGKVQRNSDGKEVRFPVILTFREKEIARRIVLNFKQFICGFDILRVQEDHSLVSYVCDVNGFSFVKNSRKYYDDCAQILSEHILAVLKPKACKGFSTVGPLTLSRRDTVQPNDKKVNNTLLFRAARMLLGQSRIDDIDDTVIGNSSPNGSPQSSSSVGYIVNGNVQSGSSAITAAATLVEGALPVREFPSNLTSEPASMNQSRSSSPTFSRQTSGTTEETSHQEELRCVVAIIRHGDRTPKQKLKTVLKEPHILDFFHKHVNDCRKDLKVKGKAPMTEFLHTVKATLHELQQVRSADTEGLRYQLIHMRDILERWKIVGLNRKLQIKPCQFEEYIDETTGEAKTRCSEVKLILKWGGNLTILGEKQAINLGRRLRVEMYPDAPGGGILRLHSTFRHDLKIKTSDEGRVMKTAAAFAKGLLELEGDIPPILVSLVHKEKGSMHMLDPSGNKEVKAELEDCKKKITKNLQLDIKVSESSEEELERFFGPKCIMSIRRSLEKMENPRTTLLKIYSIMGELLRKLEDMVAAQGSGDEGKQVFEEGVLTESSQDFALSGVKLYKGETLIELTERWRFIYDRLCTFDDDNNMIFDLSRIPDIHDNVRFDMLHNPHLGLSVMLDQLYELAKTMADCVVPQEYGTTIEEKRSVGVKICHGLLEKIKYDLAVARADNDADMRYMINMDYSSDIAINTMGRRIRTRLYFTSESHLHTVLNVLRFGSAEHRGSPMLSEEGVQILAETPELCYLTQIVIRVFEDSRSKMAHNPRRFRVEIYFSPGANATPQHLQEHIRDSDTTRFDTAPLRMIGRDGLTCEELEEFFDAAIKAGKSSKDDDDDEDDNSYSTTHDRFSVTTPNAKKSPVSTKSKGYEKKKDFECSKTSNVNSGVGKNRLHVVHETEANDSIANRSEINDDKTDDDRINRIVTRKFKWGSVAIGSFVVGVGFVLLALRLSSRNRVIISSTGIRRWQSTGRR